MSTGDLSVDRDLLADNSGVSSSISTVCSLSKGYVFLLLAESASALALLSPL